jgi:uncharacterized protein YjiS (DUF1127 family)
MAHASYPNTYAHSSEPPGILARLRQALAKHRAYWATCEELNALSDRELADLGLSRLAIRDVAREASYGR